MSAEPLKAADWERIEALFPDLLDLPPDQREAFLDRECAGQPLLRAELVSLLGAAGRDSVLDQSPLLSTAASTVLPGATLEAGERVGAWRIISPLGRGGMGEVYLAGRIEGGFTQRAAVKVLRPEASAHAERFDAERSILAQLEHPNIARLLDGGHAANGRAWMAMEYVDGEPIDAYCRRLQPTLAERIGLFTQVCSAVAFAHATLVIHRDLKPANILVTPGGTVKLLDFGVAKLLDLPSGRTTATAPFTPEHAAPEQLEGKLVTTSVDIFALGVILYELLCDHRPWSFGETPLSQMVDRLLRDEPPPPSVVATRNDDRPLPAKLLVGDLDAIVHKCLRKLPADRYPTVEALARDIRRWQQNEPVTARRGNVAYQARRWFQRHRFTATAAALATAALVTGAAVAAWQFNEARVEAARAQRALDFLIGVFEQADPDRGRGAATTALELLASAETRIDADLAGDPRMQADLDRVLARIYYGLDDQDRAVALAKRALARLPEGDDARRAEILVVLGNALNQQRDAGGAAALEEAVAILLREQGPDSPELARARLGLGVAYTLQGQRESALAIQQSAHTVLMRTYGPQHPDVARAAQALGQTNEMIGDYAAAERWYREAMAGLAALRGDENAGVADLHADLGGLLDRIGRREEAERELAHAERIFRAAYGDSHPRLAYVRFSQAILFIGEKRFAEADAALEETLRIYPEDSYLHAQSLRYLGRSLLRQQRLDEAATRLAAADAGFRKHAPDTDPQRFRVQADLAEVALRQGRPEEALPPLSAAVAALTALTGADSYELRVPLKLQGEALSALGRHDEAIATLERVLTLEEKLLGAGHRDTAGSRRLLAKALLDARHPDAATRAAALLAPLLADADAMPVADRDAAWAETRWLAARVASARGDHSTASTLAGEALAAPLSEAFRESAEALRR